MGATRHKSPHSRPAPALRVRPLTPDRWPDLVRLFGERGCGGCWCMWWRLTRREFDRGSASNKAALKALTDAGRVPGLLAYAGDRPVGWCSVAPRAEFGRLSRSRALAPVDDRPVWSVVCFHVHREFRGIGVATRLLEEAVRYAASRGAKTIEGYPRETTGARESSQGLYHGAASMFRKAGFREVIRRLPTRPVMRRETR